MLAGAKSAPAAVAVLEQQRVAGFDAAVLQAPDATALDAWLRQHGYRSSPELLEWYKPYVADKWVVTAFKVAGPVTKAVRMSFQSERAFFPYREPAAGSAARKPPERILRVYFLAHERYEGRLGETAAWAGRAVWSGDLEERQRERLLKAVNLPAMAGGGGLRLTEFVDHSSPRPGSDEVYFARAANQQPLKPEPEAETAITQRVIVFAALLLAILALIGGLHYYFRKRS